MPRSAGRGVECHSGRADTALRARLQARGRVEHRKQLGLPLALVIHRRVHQHRAGGQINDHPLTVVAIEIQPRAVGSVVR